MMRQFFVGTILLALVACDSAVDGTYQGYVEGEYVTVAAPLGGRVAKLHVVEGARVARGVKLFELDPTAEQAQLAEASQRASGDADEVGASLSQRAASQAARDQAKADHDLAVVDLERARKLFNATVIDQAAFDAATTREATAAARLRQAGQNVAVSAATSRAADAVVTQAKWRVDQMTGVAPADGLVTLVARREGEWVAPGGGVIRFLPDGGRLVRFFVPQAALPSFTPGTKVTVAADGVASPIPYQVTRVGEKAEYTPPFIYSRESREKLVFLVEARSDEGSDLPPGLPVTVSR